MQIHKVEKKGFYIYKYNKREEKYLQSDDIYNLTGCKKGYKNNFPNINFQ